MTARSRAGPRIGLIAGSGRLPIEVAQSLCDQGSDIFVLLVKNEAEALPIFVGSDHAWLAPAEFGALVSILKAAGVDRVILAGGVSSRPALRAIRWTWSLAAMLPRLLRALASGDDVLLRTIIGHLEANGIKVVGAHEVVPDLLAARGAMTSTSPNARDRTDIAAAAKAARAIGVLDIGQAAIAIGGRTIALEGIEGTAGLIDRVAGLRGHGRLADRTGGVLVKCAKPGQDLRADLPAIGPDTVEAAFAAGLAGIAVEAGRSFVLDYAATIARADALGLFVIGMEGDG